MPASTTLSELFTDWNGFEHFVAELHRTGSVEVEHNVTVIGRSGASRQIDVLVRHKVGLYEHLIVIECKFWNSPVERQHVDALATTIREVGASRGVIFSVEGFQHGAIAQARHESIGLYKIRPLDDDEWGKPGRYIDLWLHIVSISIGAFKMPGSMCVGQPPTGPLIINLDSMDGSRSSHTPLRIPGNSPTTLEDMLIDTGRQCARKVYKPIVMNFDGAEEGDFKVKLKVEIKPKIPAEATIMGALMLLPEMNYELGVKISQSRIRMDRGRHLAFVLAVEDCITKSVNIASRATDEDHTIFSLREHNISPEVPFENGSIASIWLSNPVPFDEFADVPLSADGPFTAISLSSLDK
jgi:hypothetical protein